MKHALYRGVLFASAMIPTAAWAHPGLHGETSFMSGFSHPLMGIDHILAMISVGLLAAHLGGRSLWAVPNSFILAMVVGGTLGVAGVHIPVVEAGIAASVIVLGVLVAFIISAMTLYSVAVDGARFNATVYEWMTLGSLKMEVGFLIDGDRKSVV